MGDFYFLHNSGSRRLLHAWISILVILFASCSGNEKKEVPADTDSVIPVPEEFHADNDIAMVVRSLADAIRVGEPLDSTEYDFNGVLTDGQGTPLYTDVEGAPGEWVIDVLDTKNVTIRNVYLGDLLPAALETYILQSLQLDEAVPLEYDEENDPNDEDTKSLVYDFNGGFLRFEIRSGIAQTGVEGPLLTVNLSATPPAGLKSEADKQEKKKEVKKSRKRKSKRR